MRRLPVFFLIDVSESMVGDPIKSVNEGLNQIVLNLKNNPTALETVFISIIVFAGKTKLVLPLSDLLNYNHPQISIGGGTALGDAMMFLMDEIDSTTQKTTVEIKGDWKPLVFLFTDGVPTDDVAPAINRWKSKFDSKATLIAISFGYMADLTVLKEITDNVLIFSETDPNVYKDFFNWISSSIEAKSINVIAESNEIFQLPVINEKFLIKAELYSEKQITFDERFAILLARCQNTRKPYLIKFVKEPSGMFFSEAAYTISEDYFSLTAKGEYSAINVNQLANTPVCPECENPNIASCACGKLFCLGPDSQNICPWCEQKIHIEFSSDFDISRTQG